MVTRWSPAHALTSTNLRSDNGVLTAAMGLLLLLSDSSRGRSRILEVCMSFSPACRNKMFFKETVESRPYDGIQGSEDQ